MYAFRWFGSLALLLPLLAQGAITHQETASNTGTIASSGTLTVTMAGAATDGELLVGICHRDSATDTTEAATSFPAGWTKATAISVSETAGRDRVVDVGYKIASSEGTNYAFTNNGDASEEMQCVVLVYSDVNGTQLDVTPTASHYVFSSNSDAPDPPSITTATNNALVIAFATASGATNSRTCTAPTTPNSFTLRHGTTDPIAEAFICAAEYALATAGAYNPGTYTINNGNGCPTCTDETYAATIAIAPASTSNSVLFYVDP